MSGIDHRLIASLLLSFLCFVVFVTVAVSVLLRRWHRLHNQRQFAISQSHHELFRSKNSKPLGTTPACWLAIKNRNLPLIESALALHNPKPCAWVEGLSGGSGSKLFISPPIAGWVLVVGPALPEPDDDIDECFKFLVDLSLKVGHVQYFQVNEMLGHHAWARAERGQIIRGYAWTGQTVWNQGDETDAEKDLELQCYGYLEKPSGNFHIPVAVGNGEKLHLLAAAWSVDPENIDRQCIEQEWGIAGEP